MIRSWWKRQSPWERVAWVLVVLCLVTAGTVKPTVRWISPQLAVQASFERQADVLLMAEGPFPEAWRTAAKWGGHHQNEAVDPWGMQWHWAGSWTWMQYYSLGPNRIDEQVGGDDIPVFVASRLTLFLGWAEEVAIAFTVSVLWLLLCPLRKAPRSASLVREVWRGTLLASIPLALSTCVVVWVTTHVTGYRPSWVSAFSYSLGRPVKMLPDPLGVILQVPASVGILGVLVLAWSLAALAIRLHPLAQEAEAA